MKHINMIFQTCSDNMYSADLNTFVVGEDGVSDANGNLCADGDRSYTANVGQTFEYRLEENIKELDTSTH